MQHELNRALVLNPVRPVMDLEICQGGATLLAKLAAAYGGHLFFD